RPFRPIRSAREPCTVPPCVQRTISDARAPTTHWRRLAQPADSENFSVIRPRRAASRPADALRRPTHTARPESGRARPPRDRVPCEKRARSAPSDPCFVAWAVGRQLAISSKVRQVLAVWYGRAGARPLSFLNALLDVFSPLARLEFDDSNVGEAASHEWILVRNRLDFLSALAN